MLHTLLAVALSQGSMYVPTQLRVERLLPQDAFGIDTPNPVLSWDLLPAGKAQQQQYAAFSKYISIYIYLQCLLFAFIICNGLITADGGGGGGGGAVTSVSIELTSSKNALSYGSRAGAAAAAAAVKDWSHSFAVIPVDADEQHVAVAPVVYEGKLLESSTKYYWQICITTNGGVKEGGKDFDSKQSTEMRRRRRNKQHVAGNNNVPDQHIGTGSNAPRCSEPASFVTGIMAGDVWQASWIGGASVRAPVKCKTPKKPKETKRSNSTQAHKHKLSKTTLVQFIRIFMLTPPLAMMTSCTVEGNPCMASYHSWCPKNVPKEYPRCGFTGLQMKSPPFPLENTVASSGVAAATVTAAVIHVTGLGMYELYLNGGKVGDAVLDPVRTNVLILLQVLAMCIYYLLIIAISKHSRILHVGYCLGLYDLVGGGGVFLRAALCSLQPMHADVC